MSYMASLAALCLLLVFPLSSSQSTLRSEQEINVHQVPAAPPPPPAPPRVRDLLSEEEDAGLKAQQRCESVSFIGCKYGL